MIQNILNSIEVTKLPTKYQHQIIGHSIISYKDYYILIYCRRNHRYKYIPKIKDSWSVISKELFTVDLPKPREWHTMVYFQDFMYIFGGINPDDQIHYNDIWKFDPLKETFLEITTKNQIKQRYKHTAVVIDCYMVVFGGISWNETLDLLSIFSFENKSWNEPEKTKDTPPKTYGHSAVVYNNEMYIFGGQNFDKANNQLYSYSIKNGWSLIKAKYPPEARKGHASIVFKDKMYIYGGENYIRNELKRFGDLFVYNFETNTFTEIIIKNPPKPRTNCKFVEFLDDVYLFGGDIGLYKDNPKIKDNFYKFNLNPNSITFIKETVRKREDLDEKKEIIEKNENTKSEENQPKKLKRFMIKSEIEENVHSEEVKIPNIKSEKPQSSIEVSKNPVLKLEFSSKPPTFKLFKMGSQKQDSVKNNDIIIIEDD